MFTLPDVEALFSQITCALRQSRGHYRFKPSVYVDNKVCAAAAGFICRLFVLKIVCRAHGSAQEFQAWKLNLERLSRDTERCKIVFISVLIVVFRRTLFWPPWKSLIIFTSTPLVCRTAFASLAWCDNASDGAGPAVLGIVFAKRNMHADFENRYQRFRGL